MNLTGDGSTRAVAEAIADVAAAFPFLGSVSADELLEVVRLELGHEEILDGFRPYGRGFAKAFGPGNLVHIVSGNTPHAALQSLIRGLILRAHNRVKLPSSGLPEVAEFAARLPAELGALVETNSELPPQWLREADGVIVFGSDETIAAVRSKVPISTPFQPHGTRVSLAVIFDDLDYGSVDAVARDVSLFDQQGCMSPHCIYIADRGPTNPRTYAARLAEAMAKFNASEPRGKLSVGEAASIVDLRTNYAFRSASDVRVQIWCSEGSTDWTVVYEDDPWFATSPLNRFVFVKPLPADLASALGPVQAWLGGIAIWPPNPNFAESLASLGASRICPVGQLQFPPWTWHADGTENLTQFVRWVDFETEIG